MLNSPLTDPRYQRIFCAQVTSLFGTGLTTIALALLAHEIAGGEAGAVLGTALALKMLAYVAIAPVIGAYIQRFPRRKLLVALDIFRAAVVCVLPFIDQVWQIYLLVFLLNVFSAGFTPVFQATIPDIIKDKDRYTKALSYSRLAYDLENLLSPMLAAALISVTSFGVLFQLNALTFMASALLVLSIRLPDQKLQNAVTGFWRRLTYGVAIYLKTPRLRAMFALCMAVAAAGSMQIVNTVVYVRTVLQLDEVWVALAFAAAGAGSMLVALTLPRVLLKVAERNLMVCGGFLMSAGLFLGLLEPSITGLLCLWFLLGVGSSAVLTPVGRLLTASCRETDRPAVFAAQFALSHACWLIAYPLSGWLGGLSGIQSAFFVLGVITLLSTVTAVLIWPRLDESELVHYHAAHAHQHMHFHDEHHQHQHEGWEGPEPHSHPHQHSGVKHRHVFVIDDHHLQWPK
ncbi:MFS transporter [Hahella sp. HN01]|uniref:MFS transporter n=1 Tax=Hahella sp. HN01 TaxID=2847262 RepID=UPI001C1EE579|nr:MFS transporter [Hahella sp. HN01]MBU6955537.1 MFS transporter [Hahella sp. HN01]